MANETGTKLNKLLAELLDFDLLELWLKEDVHASVIFGIQQVRELKKLQKLVVDPFPEEDKNG